MGCFFSWRGIGLLTWGKIFEARKHFLLEKILVSYIGEVWNDIRGNIGGWHEALGDNNGQLQINSDGKWPGFICWYRAWKKVIIFLVKWIDWWFLFGRSNWIRS